MKINPQFCVSLVFAITALLGTAYAGGCPNGGCSGGGGMVMSTFKGGASRLPVVTSVDGNKFTANNKTFLINGDAAVSVDGKAADENAIKVGMRVMVTGKLIDQKNKLYKATQVAARTP
jgi:hypothetical protein